MVASSVAKQFPVMSVTIQCTFQPSHSPVVLFNVASDALEKLIQLLLPGVLYCHWYFKPVPLALTLKETFSPAPAHTTSSGCASNSIAWVISLLWTV